MFPFLTPLLIQRQRRENQGTGEEGQADWPSEKNRPVTFKHYHPLAKFRLGNIAEDHSKYYRSSTIPETVEKITEHAEDQQQVDIKKITRNAKRSDDTEQQDNRDQVASRN